MALLDNMNIYILARKEDLERIGDLVFFVRQELEKLGKVCFLEALDDLEDEFKGSNDYFLVWNVNEIPCHRVTVFSDEARPILDIGSAHALIKKNVVLELLEREKGLVNLENLIDEYISYVLEQHPDEFEIREWEMFADAGEFLPVSISLEDINWLSKDYDSIYFERETSLREYFDDVFTNKYYQEKLSPKQMLRVVLEEHSEATEDDICVEDRLKYLSKDTYKEYEKLGDDLVDKNIDQAYLCYENAEYLCDDSSDREIIIRKKNSLKDTGLVKVRKTAFIILSYNNTYLMQRCIESIYSNCNPEAYTLIILDNNSQDGVDKWLAKWGEAHDEAIIILSKENLGFSGGCNAASKYAINGEDLLFMNNDVRVPANALFWLRMALYESDRIGGVGAVQNYYGNSRREKVNFGVVEQYMEYGAKKNVYEELPYEKQSKLCGFALLIKRAVWDEIEGFDERLNPGFLEDDDISLQIRDKGYDLEIVHNSFIYHAGSQSFRKRDDIDELYLAHREIIHEKWGFDSSVIACISEKQLEFIDSLEDKGYTEDSEFSLLHIGCGCGNMLGHIHYLYPKAFLAGVEDNDAVRRFAIKNLNIVKATCDLPRPASEFDLIFEN